jgi:hypothetical protein
MKSTSPAWRTYSRFTKSRCRKGSPWSVWMRSRWCCTPMSARRGRCGRDKLPARLRVRAARHGQRLLRRPAQGRAALYQTNFQPLLAAVRRLPGGDRSQLSEADTIHLVMDNLSSHNRKALVDRFGEKIGGLLWERFTVHYTPKHGSWLNQAEIEISLFSRQCLGQRRIPSLNDLRREAKAWNRKDEPQPCHHQLAVHAQKGTPEVRLRQKQNHTVRDLVVAEIVGDAVACA